MSYRCSPITYICYCRFLLETASPVSPGVASVASVARRLKGGSSRVIRADFPDLPEFLWGESTDKTQFCLIYSDGYFAESVWQQQEQVIRRYIKDEGKSNRNK